MEQTSAAARSAVPEPKSAGVGSPRRKCVATHRKRLDYNRCRAARCQRHGVRTLRACCHRAEVHGGAAQRERRSIRRSGGDVVPVPVRLIEFGLPVALSVSVTAPFGRRLPTEQTSAAERSAVLELKSAEVVPSPLKRRRRSPQATGSQRLPCRSMSASRSSKLCEPAATEPKSTAVLLSVSAGVFGGAGVDVAPLPTRLTATEVRSHRIASNDELAGFRAGILRTKLPVSSATGPAAATKAVRVSAWRIHCRLR